MGFISRFFGGSERAKKRTRGPTRSGTERLKAEEARFLRQLERTDPEAYQDLMRKRLGISRPEEKDAFEELEKSVARLRKMGIIKGANDLGDSPSAWIKDAVQGLAMVIPMFAAGGQGVLPAVAATQALPAPQPTAPASVEHAPPDPEPPIIPQKEEDVHPASMYLIAELEHKTPAEAAEWLLSQPQAKQMVTMLPQIPDSQLMPTLGQIADAQPMLRGWVNWLRLRETWVRATVAEIRKRVPPGGSAGGLSI